MQRYVLLTALLSLFALSRCHCPHMMGMKGKPKPDGPAMPSSLPQDDKGWDYDESSGAPGHLPQQHFIQTSFVHRSLTESERKFAEMVTSSLREIKDRLKREARITIDNENIECKTQEDNVRCFDFPANGAFHYLVVEDSSHGAAVYSLEKKYNERSEGTTEMALLDALSRHSPMPLTVFASAKAEKDVGFVRLLTAKEVNALAAPSKKLEHERFSPFELNLIDNDLLQLRHGEGLEKIEHKLTKLENEKQLNEQLAQHERLFVLFWTNVFTESLHVFNQFALASNDWSRDDIPLFHVACHEKNDLCDGMQRKDFVEIIAYKNGNKLTTTNSIGDARYYTTWMILAADEPMIELGTVEELKDAKRGKLSNGFESDSLVVAQLPSKESTEFKHLEIAAEKLFGRYVIAFNIDPSATATLSVYRRNENPKRSGYVGEFDPASLISFISTASLPSVLDISNGFTTEALFRQRRSIVAVSNANEETMKHFRRLAVNKEARKDFNFVSLDSNKDKSVDEVLLQLAVPSDSSQVILLEKERVFHAASSTFNSADDIWQWVLSKDLEDGDLNLQASQAHPFRLLQAAHINRIFGQQNILLLPDQTLLQQSESKSQHPHIPASASGGGCPFMAGGGALHEEL